MKKLKVGDKFKVTKAELKKIRDITVCSRACEKLVERVVKHFEANEIARDEWWSQINKKYFPEITTQVPQLFIDHKSGEVKVVSLDQKKDEIATYLNDFEVRSFIREDIKKAFQELK